MGRRAAILLIFLSLVALVAAGVWRLALAEALARLEDRGRADLVLAADRLTGQLRRYREVTVLMADHPGVAALVSGAAADGAAVGQLLLGAGALVLALAERRRALSERLAAQAAANADLEARVTARTQAISEVNEQLRRAQAELVQAGKLAALGEMSAGISHELNQPLMAIRSYTDTPKFCWSAVSRARSPTIWPGSRTWPGEWDG